MDAQAMVRRVADRLEAVYLATCQGCGWKQVLADLDPDELAGDMIEHRWLIIDGWLRCPACVESLADGEAK